MKQSKGGRSNGRKDITVVGIILGAVLSLLFAATGNPGLMGVGVVIGFGIGSALEQKRSR